MTKFKLEKLVRDKIAQRMVKEENASYRILDQKEFFEESKKKLLEEAGELKEVGEEGKIVKELADLQELIDALVRCLKIRTSDLQKIQSEENQKSGSFKNRVFIESIEIDGKNPWLKYYLDHPKRYPKIKD